LTQPAKGLYLSQLANENGKKTNDENDEEGSHVDLNGVVLNGVNIKRHGADPTWQTRPSN